MFLYFYKLKWAFILITFLIKCLRVKEILDCLTNSPIFYIMQCKYLQHYCRNYFGVTDVRFTVTVSFVILRAVAKDVRVAPKSNYECGRTHARIFWKACNVCDFSINALYKIGCIYENRKRNKFDQRNIYLQEWLWKNYF